MVSPYNKSWLCYNRDGQTDGRLGKDSFQNLVRKTVLVHTTYSVHRKQSFSYKEPIYCIAIFFKIVVCVAASIVRIYHYSIRIHFSVCLDHYF